ncbi:MAG: hypothetical protein V5A38_11610 [Halolamina sp.]|uniref:hypothetical protein n=1 Tax=Halolamina sp. TaxID=1940283 RepID=UPI002FC2C4F1
MVRRSPPAATRRGVALLALAIVTVAIAYPPPATGVLPLFGIGNLFLLLGLSVGALFAAALGGFFLARSVAEQFPSLSTPIARLLVPAAAVALVGAYLVTVAGFLEACSSPWWVWTVGLCFIIEEPLRSTASTTLVPSSRDPNAFA